MRADCVAEESGALLRIYVDGEELAERRHRQGLGQLIGIGLFAYSRGGDTDVRFDNVVVREISSR